MLTPHEPNDDPQHTAWTDAYGRAVTYLRLSITDRCNFRCVYCMPQEGITREPAGCLLSFEEIERVVRVLVRLGIRRVRVTGGEPLVRRGVMSLFERLTNIPNLREVTLTTNGTRLGHHAPRLVELGVRNVTVSLDSLHTDRFAKITRGGDLERVLYNIRRAQDAGLHVRINTVIVRGFNDDEILDLVEWATHLGVTLRFIEFMPIGSGTAWAYEYADGARSCVPAAELRSILATRWTLHELGMTPGKGPARYMRLSGGNLPADQTHQPQVGIISAVTECFCDACNRVRLTPQGGLRTCLADDQELHVRDLLRSGVSDHELSAALCAALGQKQRQHTFDLHGDHVTQKPMISIGG